MAQITKIKQQKNKNRVNVFLDGKFGFGIDLENFVKLNLKVGDEHTKEEIENIVKTAEFTKTYEKLLKFAMLRPRSRKEITDWFWRKKVHESIQDELISKLENLELIGDFKFAKWWVGQRLEFRNKSEREIESELYKKGIDKNIIKKALSKAEINEINTIKKLIRKNKHKWARYDQKIAKQKAVQYLLRKGFIWNDIKKALETELKLTDPK